MSHYVSEITVCDSRSGDFIGTVRRIGDSSLWCAMHWRQSRGREFESFIAAIRYLETGGK